MNHWRCNRHRDLGTLPQLCATCQRIDVERQIASKIVDTLLATGFSLSVHDSEEITVRRSSNRDEILNAMFTTDIDNLLTHKTSTQGGHDGFVQFVYGNSGWDVVSDYSLGLESVLEPAFKWAEQFEV